MYVSSFRFCNIFIVRQVHLRPKVPKQANFFAEPLTKLNVFELLHLQILYFYFFANITKMTKDIKIINNSAIKLV